MSDWQEPIRDAVDRYAAEQLERELRGEPASGFGPRSTAIYRLIEEAAVDVDRELRQDTDPVALQRHMARLALLTAYYSVPKR